MFRPFLPCGIAYGFAYALPMAFHALFPAEGIPPGCLYCTISARCLSTGFGRISAAFAFSGAGGVPPCRGGDCSGVAGALRGACLVCRLLTLPLVFDFAPYPPSPLPRRGRGRPRLFSCKGLRPLHPRGWMGHGTGFACGKPILAASNGTLAPAGGGNPDCKKPLPLCICMAGAVSAASGSVQGCRGRSPRRNKLLVSPLPAGKGVGGMGAAK